MYYHSKFLWYIITVLKHDWLISYCCVLHFAFVFCSCFHGIPFSSLIPSEPVLFEKEKSSRCTKAWWRENQYLSLKSKWTSIISFPFLPVLLIFFPLARDCHKMGEEIMRIKHILLYKRLSLVWLFSFLLLPISRKCGIQLNSLKFTLLQSILGPRLRVKWVKYPLCQIQARN